jgi:hypothetical protein
MLICERINNIIVIFNVIKQTKYVSVKWEYVNKLTILLLFLMWLSKRNMAQRNESMWIN